MTVYTNIKDKSILGWIEENGNDYFSNIDFSDMKHTYKLFSNKEDDVVIIDGYTMLYRTGYYDGLNINSVDFDPNKKPVMSKYLVLTFYDITESEFIRDVINDDMNEDMLSNYNIDLIEATIYGRDKNGNK